MTFTITLVEVISCAIGIILGYKLKKQIESLIASIKKVLSNFLTPKTS